MGKVQDSISSYESSEDEDPYKWDLKVTLCDVLVPTEEDVPID